MLIFQMSPNFLNEIMTDFVGCLKSSVDKKYRKFGYFLHSAQLILHVTDNLTFMPGNTIEMIQVKIIATHADFTVSN